MERAPWLWPLFAAGAFGGGWHAYFRWKDKAHPEPKWIIAIALVGGMLAVGGALLGFRLFETPDWEVVATGAWAKACAAALSVWLWMLKSTLKLEKVPPFVR